MPYVTWTELTEPGDADDFFARRPMAPFDPAACGYSEANAVWLMEMSRIVYRHDIEEELPPPEPTRRSYLERAGFRQLHFFRHEETGTAGMLVQSTGPTPFAVLAFRGTEKQLQDYVTDLKLGRPPLGSDGVVIHEGFLEAIDSVWASVEAALRQVSGPLFYTGHSLGAALATLAAYRHPPTALYTFGSPYVGDAAFVAKLGDVPTYRCVDASDIVPKLPPAELGYVHVGELHHLTAPKRGFAENLAHLLEWLREPPRFLADHTPINYTDRIGGEQRS
jgi:triacylglycerol lipase